MKRLATFIVITYLATFTTSGSSLMAAVCSHPIKETSKTLCTKNDTQCTVENNQKFYPEETPKS